MPPLPRPPRPSAGPGPSSSPSARHGCSAIWSERFGDRHFILTVSPIRHLKDGLHGNQLSKATLLLAEDILVRTCPNAEYFPSYEIIIDELRDRTWFEADGAHPTQAAVDIVWDRFKNAAQIL